MLASILIPLPLAGVIVYTATHILNDYGLSLFLGMPLVLPMASVLLYAGREPRTWGQCARLGLCWILTVALIVLATAFEGLICVVMMLPLAIPMALLGATIGFGVAGLLRCSLETDSTRGAGKTLVMLLASLPAMVGAEHAVLPEPPLYAVSTAVEIDAPPERVWRHVIAFPDLPPPTDPVFLAGIAYPLRARIEGEGVGAVRYCEFTTGDFVEPIEMWDEPRLLRFSVTSNAPPMKEWNPFYDVQPPHLDGFLVSQRGQFHLTPQPNGGTRLEGTTWYRHGLWPAGYWRVWSDEILHRIHAYVLNHIKTLAEHP